MSIEKSQKIQQMVMPPVPKLLKNSQSDYSTSRLPQIKMRSTMETSHDSYRTLTCRNSLKKNPSVVMGMTSQRSMKNISIKPNSGLKGTAYKN